MGLVAPEAAAHHRDNLRSVPQLYGDEVRTLLEACVLVPESDHTQAQRARAALQAAWRRMFADIDLLLAPTVPHTAPLHGQHGFTWPDGTEESVVSAYIRLSTPANVLGLPALTVPVGLDRAGRRSGCSSSAGLTTTPRCCAPARCWSRAARSALIRYVGKASPGLRLAPVYALLRAGGEIVR